MKVYILTKEYDTELYDEDLDYQVKETFIEGVFSSIELAKFYIADWLVGAEEAWDLKWEEHESKRRWTAKRSSRPDSYFIIDEETLADKRDIP